MIPPSLIDYVLSRGLADGVLVAGCAERSAYHRLGVAWTRERIAGERNPYLRARVPRERLATIWASRTEQSRFSSELAQFTAALAALPPHGHAVRADGAPSSRSARAEEEEAVS
jgi:coenzyme F420-reducing hydrogenase delta subunit